MFASAPPRRSSVAWLEPGRRRRRGRDGIPWRAALIVLLVLAAAGGAAYYVIDRHHKADMRRDAAQSFVRAWARGDEPAMWATLDARSRAAYPRARFQRLYRTANDAATVTGVRVGNLAGPNDGVFTAPVAVATRQFGTLRGTVRVAGA